MAESGLEIREEQFIGMTQKQQNLILFKNIMNLDKKIDRLNKRDDSYNLNKKIQYYWLSFLTLLFFAYMGIKQKLGL